MRDGLLLVAHGSRSRAGQEEMHDLAERVAAVLPDVEVGVGFLELSDPPAGVALDRLVEAGVDRVAVVPLMLFAAGHAKSDVPAVVLEAQDRHPAVAVRYGRPFGVDHVMIDIGRAAIETAGGEGMPLAVLFRGTSDPAANGDAYKAARLLAEATSSPLFSVGFSGVTAPTVPQALEQLRLQGVRRVAAFAWFLATGVLVDRMKDDFHSFAADTGIEVVDAGHLSCRDHLAAVIVDRYREAVAGDVRVNCDTCVYRRPFPGLEQRVAQPIGVGHSHLALQHRHHH